MKEKIRKNRFQTGMYLILFILSFTVHLLLPSDVGDDVWFRTMGTQMSLGNFLSWRYEVWTSRLVIEAVMMVLLQLPHFVWGITDSLMVVLLVHSLIRLLNIAEDRKKLCILIGMFILYPLTYFRSAGWYATTLNYLWPMATGFYVLSVMYDAFCGKKPGWKTWIAVVVCLAYAINQEQMCALIFGFGVFGLLFDYLKEHRLNPVILICFLASVVGLLFLMLCPGNALRNMQEMQNWYPAYEAYGAADQAVLSVLSTFSCFFYHKVFLIHLFLMLLVYLARQKGNNRLALLSGIPLAGLSAGNIISFINSRSNHTFMPVVARFTQPLEGSVITADSIAYLIVILILFAVTVYVMYRLFPLPEFLLIGIVMCAAFCERFVMGFSPTVFASGDRTFLITYLLFLFLDTRLLFQILDGRKIVNNN